MEIISIVSSCGKKAHTGKHVLLTNAIVMCEEFTVSNLFDKIDMLRAQESIETTLKLEKRDLYLNKKICYYFIFIPSGPFYVLKIVNFQYEATLPLIR